MGMTTGVVSTGGNPAANVTIEFLKAGLSMGVAQTDANGNYAKYLPAGIYTAKKLNPDAPCSPSPLNIPVGALRRDLTY